MPLDGKLAGDKAFNAAFKDKPDVKSRLETEWDTAAKSNYVKAIDRADSSRANEVDTMPRVREIEDDGGDPILKEIFAKERELFGGLLNTTKVYAHCPPILKAAKQLSASIEKSGLLPAALVPLVYLRVALINGCPF